MHINIQVEKKSSNFSKNRFIDILQRIDIQIYRSIAHMLESYMRAEHCHAINMYAKDFPIKG